MNAPYGYIAHHTKGNITMKVLLINGSPHEKGCTYTGLCEVEKTLNANGIDTEIIWLGNGAVRDCIACGACRKLGKCVFDDDICNEIIAKAENADGFVFGTPVYYAHPSGRVLSIMDRLFYSGSKHFAHKPAASIVCARRGGTTASFDVMNKYFTIAQMPVVSSTYWNNIHGNKPEEALQDLEGMQIMRNLGTNMAWLIKCIELGKNNGVPVPTAERGNVTNFIR